jgi:D-beta-D-heptose 7-phosphate kinase/D-beta-D-heptose 1-phosphate adenosyltransferase
VNTDASVRRLKGPSRPIVTLEDRAAVLRALACVDLVVAFDDDTPLRLIEAVQPDVLVKGADYAVGEIVGREVVEARGGLVTTIALREGLSTSTLVERIRTGRGV